MDRLGLFVSIYFFSPDIGLFLASKRNSFSGLRVPYFQVLKRASISALGLSACLLIRFRDHLITNFCIRKRGKPKVPLPRKHNYINFGGYKRLYIVLHALHWWKVWQDWNALVQPQSDWNSPLYASRSLKYCSRLISWKYYWLVPEYRPIQYTFKFLHYSSCELTLHDFGLLVHIPLSHQRNERTKNIRLNLRSQSKPEDLA